VKPAGFQEQTRVYLKEKECRGGSPAWGLGMGLTTLIIKKKLVTKQLTESRTWLNSLDKHHKQHNMDTRFGMWNIRSLYRAGSVVKVRI
jgi:hypothetical protein